MASLSPAQSGGASAPQSVEKISRLAQDYKFNPAVPLRYWLRTAATLVREVSDASMYLCHCVLMDQVRLESTCAKDMMNRHTSSSSDMLS